MSATPNQPDLFTGTTPPTAPPAPSGAGAALSALETEAAYVLPVLCRYWCAATTRKDWKQLTDWLDVLADNAALYKSAHVLDDFHQLQRLAIQHRKQAGRVKP